MATTIFLYFYGNKHQTDYSMVIIQNSKEYSISTEEPVTAVRQGIKYMLLANEWVPIQIMKSVRLIDLDLPLMKQQKSVSQSANT